MSELHLWFAQIKEEEDFAYLYLSLFVANSL